MSRELACRDLITLHAEIDRRVAPLEATHRARLQCGRGCSGCCVDGITVFEVEAERIRREAAPVLAETPGPAGGCAFLDAAGACRIYEHRPYVCRTQGLPLRWLEERGEELVELRDICPLNEDGPPLEILPEETCWTIGPVEQRLQEIERGWGGDQARVALRELFKGR